MTKLEPDEVAMLPSNLEAAGKPYAFEPFGLRFEAPIKITVPFEDDATDVCPLKLDNREDDTWSTVVGSERDPVKQEISYASTTLGVTVAARPRRGSGVITQHAGGWCASGSQQRHRHQRRRNQQQR